MSFPVRDDYDDDTHFYEDRGAGASVGGRLRPSVINSVANISHDDIPHLALNQRVETSIPTADSGGGAEQGPYTRLGPGTTYYEWQCYRTTAGANLEGIVYKYTGSFLTVVTLPAMSAWAPPHQMVLASQGATHRCYLDGSLKYTFVDPDPIYLLGNSGVRVWSNVAVANSEAEYLYADDPGDLPGPYLVGVLGTAATTTATGPPNTLSVSYTGAEKPRKGDTIVCWFTRDNIVNDPATGDSVSAQPGSETYTRVALAQPTPTSTANAGIVGGVFYARLAADWSAGTNTFTLTMPTGAADRVMSLEWWRGIGALRGTADTNGSTTNASTTTADPVAGDAVLAMNCWEQSGATAITDDTDTTNGTWSRGLRVQGAELVSGGTTAAAVKMVTQSKVVTATGSQTYNPTNATTADSVGIVLTFAPATVVPSHFDTRKIWLPAVRRAANW